MSYVCELDWATVRLLFVRKAGEQWIVRDCEVSCQGKEGGETGSGSSDLGKDNEWERWSLGRRERGHATGFGGRNMNWCEAMRVQSVSEGRREVSGEGQGGVNGGEGGREEARSGTWAGGCRCRQGELTAGGKIRVFL